MHADHYDGLFTGYLSNRETAVSIGLQRSGGTMRTESWNRLPIIRMTNISILPARGVYEDLIADTDDAILMETNRSWSIDDKRYHFQFSTEIAWEIKGGKKTRMLKHPATAESPRNFGIVATPSVRASIGPSGVRQLRQGSSLCRPWAPGTELRPRVSGMSNWAPHSQSRERC